jgi:NTE family protein
MDSTPSDATRRLAAVGERALVLGGGGGTGNAWIIGVIAGLAEAGIDVTDADLIVGTSAGSTSAVQVTTARATDLYAALVDAAPPQQPQQQRSAGPSAATRAAADNMERTSRIAAAATDPADLRRRLGAAALELPSTSDDAVQARWRATVATRLPSPDWPRRNVVITAVDAATGEPVLFDRNSGVDLVDAVAASCSSGFAYRIGDRHYIDGGYRRNAENADLAADFGRVLVLSPFGGRTRTPPEWKLDLATQVEELRAGGSRVLTVVPGPNATFGANAMDPSLRLPAARAGHEQGIALASEIADLWR